MGIKANALPKKKKDMNKINIDHTLSYTWLQKRNLKGETESLVTKLSKPFILKKESINAESIHYFYYVTLIIKL